MSDISSFACPRCFNNHGLRAMAAKAALAQEGACPRCGADGPDKLTREALEDLTGSFFVSGSVLPETHAPVYQANLGDAKPSTFDPTLARDAELIHELTGLTIFDYGPPMWRLGYTEHYWAFKEGRGAETAAEFVGAGRSLTIHPGSTFFRIRLNLEIDHTVMEPQTFESPPDSLARTPGRWDDLSHPVLYLADDIELCVHECRATIADEVVVGVLTAQEKFQVLDLGGGFEGAALTPFQDLNVLADFMSRSRGEDWLGICREVARAARSAGYDGIRYASYYAQAKELSASVNLALFGRPLIDKRLRLTSVNRLAFRNVSYRLDFGPALYRDRNENKDIL